MDASEHLLSSEKLYEVFIQHCITLKVSKYVEVFLFWIVSFKHCISFVSYHSSIILYLKLPGLDLF